MDAAIKAKDDSQRELQQTVWQQSADSAAAVAARDDRLQKTAETLDGLIAAKTAWNEKKLKIMASLSAADRQLQELREAVERAGGALKAAEQKIKDLRDLWAKKGEEAAVFLHLHKRMAGDLHALWARKKKEEMAVFLQKRIAEEKALIRAFEAWTPPPKPDNVPAPAEQAMPDQNRSGTAEADEQEAAAAEKQRLAEERSAAQAAAEEQRQAIIRRQKEQNEERKRREQEKAEAARQAARLFADDLAEEEPSAAAAEEPADDAPFTVVGKRLISNTVFKVTLQPVGSPAPDEAVAYFVSESGEAISNKKKLTQTAAGEAATVGFMLNTGVDYTVMPRCLLRIEQQGQTVGEISFRMNISFCSDF